MIPILYEKNENDFTTYGIGALSDVVSCVVTEERNGQYELILTYPISGKQYSEIQAERIIKAKAKPLGDNQLFRIYRMSKPIHGRVTIYAQHISYDLSGDVVLPFSGTYGPQGALEAVLNNTGFTAHTDKSGSKTFGSDIPKSARSMLGGSEGSVLDQWGGEYKWDNFDVYLYVNRGLDKDVVIEYGKNLTDLIADHDLSAVYSELLPYATYTDDTGTHTVTGDPISITSVITRTKTLIKDFSYDFDGPMTKAQVEAKAASWLSDNPLGYETPSLTVSFINLPAPANYPAAAATIDLCDTVTIRYTALGVDVKAKVVSCEYDTLLERYTKLTIGKPRASMADTVANLTDQSKVVADYPALWKSAIEVATQMITGNAGGNVVLHEGPDGKPFELLIMDDPDITQATKVWRWTLGGLGYSTNGYAGPYALAITADGKINADFIRTGVIDASLITAGRLLVKDSSNNVLFDANIDTNTVNIAGFSATNNGLVYNKTAQSGSGVLADKTNQFIYRISGSLKLMSQEFQYWKSQNNTPYSATSLTQLSVADNTPNTALIVSFDDKNNPTTPRQHLGHYGASSLQVTESDANGGTLERFGTSASELELVSTGNKRIALSNSDGITMQRGSKWFIVDPSDATITIDDGTYSNTIYPAGPFIEGDNSSSNVSVPSGTVTDLASFTIQDPGVYLLTATARFASNSSGNRQFCLRSGSVAGIDTNLSRELQVRTAAPSGVGACLCVAAPQLFTSATTVHLYAEQSSGSSLGVAWAYHYVRLA